MPSVNQAAIVAAAAAETAADIPAGVCACALTAAGGVGDSDWWRG
jgi:hypothetical protein